MGRRVELLSHSMAETLSLGHRLGSLMKRPKVFSFKGDLGSGKTTLIKGMIESWTGVPAGEITSPTFGLMHCYEDEIEKRSVRHFDLYRIRSLEDFLSLGFEEELDGTYACIEWPEKIEPLLPEDHVSIELHHRGENKRSIIVRADHEETLLESIELHCGSTKL